MSGKIYHLPKQKSKPGSVVQRFGNWHKGEPTVLIDNARWVLLGYPENVSVVIHEGEQNG